MQVTDYFSQIQDLLWRSSSVDCFEVEYEVKFTDVGIVHGILWLIDGSMLQFMELVSVKGDEITRLKYRFHLQDADDTMIFRYDNAPHYREIPTYPHHKHVSGGDKPGESKEIGFSDVLSEIANRVK